jgi:hypothetical protein
VWRRRRCGCQQVIAARSSARRLEQFSRIPPQVFRFAHWWAGRSNYVCPLLRKGAALLSKLTHA